MVKSNAFPEDVKSLCTVYQCSPALMDPEKRSDVVRRVLDEVSTVDGVPVDELPPIYGAIDPEALETLIGSGRDGAVTVEFTYHGYRVRVDSGGVVTVSEAEV